MKHQQRSVSWLRYMLPIAVLCCVLLTTATAQTTEQLAKKALAATVYLEMMDSTGDTVAIGSGLFVRNNLIATNYHVVEGTARGTAKLVGTYTKYTIQGVTATDKANDLALLKVSAYGIKPLRLGDSDQVNIGTQVYVAGNPKGLEGTFSDGIISSKRGGAANQRLQMTAPISPGSSGGPVLNSRGEVIGVSYMSLEGGQNLNFAIPSKYLKALLTRSQRVSSLSSVSPTVSAETYFSRGNQKYDLGDYQGAVDAYSSVIRLEPDNAVAYYNRGLAKYNLGQHVMAVADYDTAIRLNPDDAKAYYNRGIAKYRLGRHVAAITDYDSAIRLKPDYAKAYYNRGVAKYRLGQHVAAITDYDTAIRLKPDLTDAYYNRGNAKDDLGQHVAAIADYDTAIRLNPDYGNAYHNRGVAKARLNRT